jgi:hypothetical protein
MSAIQASSSGLQKTLMWYSLKLLLGERQGVAFGPLEQ